MRRLPLPLLTMLVASADLAVDRETRPPPRKPDPMPTGPSKYDLEMREASAREEAAMAKQERRRQRNIRNQHHMHIQVGSPHDQDRT